MFYTSVCVYYKDSMKSFVHLQLLQLSGVSLTLAGLRFHLVLVFLLLVQSLGLLPALLLPGELTTRETQREMRVSERRTGHIQAIRVTLYLLGLLSVFCGASAGVDPQALLEHGHACLGLAALDLGQPVLLLLLSGLEELDHTLVIAQHLLLLL